MSDEEKEGKKYTVPYTLPLKHPVKRGETEVITEIIFQRRLKGKDFKGIVAGSIKFDDMMQLISRSAAVPVSVVEEMDAEDVFSATEVINSFLPATQMTGGNA